MLLGLEYKVTLVLHLWLLLELCTIILEYRFLCTVVECMISFSDLHSAQQTYCAAV